MSLLDSLLPAAIDSLLLLPCGANPWVSCACIGLDPFRQNVDRAAAASAEAGVESVFACADPQSIPFAAASFEVVLAALLFSSRPAEEWSQLATELIRVRRYDGTILVVEGPKPEGLGLAASAGPVSLDRLLDVFEGLGMTDAEVGSLGEYSWARFT